MEGIYSVLTRGVAIERGETCRWGVTKPYGPSLLPKKKEEQSLEFESVLPALNIPQIVIASLGFFKIHSKMVEWFEGSVSNHSILLLGAMLAISCCNYSHGSTISKM